MKFPGINAADGLNGDLLILLPFNQAGNIAIGAYALHTAFKK